MLTLGRRMGLAFSSSSILWMYIYVYLLVSLGTALTHRVCPPNITTGELRYVAGMITGVALRHNADSFPRVMNYAASELKRAVVLNRHSPADC